LGNIVNIFYGSFDRGNYQGAWDMKDSHLYFAYADNMNEDIVREICPGVSYEGIAELPGYRFAFNSQGKITAIKDDSCSIWGVVWCLSTRDIFLLDKKESENLGRFEKLTTNLHFLDGRISKAFLYVTDIGDKNVYNDPLMDFIIEQAYYWSLPGKYIEYLKNIRNGNR